MNQELLLDDFLPYRLSTLSNTISNALAITCEQRFGLSTPQWQVMAVLAQSPGLSAVEVVKHTRLNKVAVSRALAKLVKSGHIDRIFADADRRRSILNLSKAGHRIHDKIAPLALQFETELLQGLSKTEINKLNTILGKLMSRAERTLPPDTTNSVPCQD